MSKRITLSGIEHIIRLLGQKPELLALSSLAPLAQIGEKAKAASATCNCNANKIYRDHKGTFEAALGNLQNGDHIVMKKLLGLDQICYYTKLDGGSLNLKCI
jgi:hypothetical protein